MLVVPKYVNSKRNVTILIVGTAIFCLLFLNIFRPFNWDLAENSHLPTVIDPSVTYFIFADVIALIALGVIAVSRVLMYKWVKKGGVLTYLIYALWITAEVLVMTVIFSLSAYYLTDAVQGSYGILFVKVLLYTGFTLLLPYLIFHFYFAWDNKTKLLQQMQSEIEQGMTTTAGPLQVSDKANTLIRFNDEKGKMRFTVMLGNLYYIESADNYVSIHYLHLDKLQTYMLRTTMKELEELAPADLVRCHRSYIVNINKVKLIRKESDGLYLGLDLEKMPIIPISKTYSSKVFAALQDNSLDINNI